MFNQGENKRKKHKLQKAGLNDGDGTGLFFLSDEVVS